jgi:hypothetical protein
MSPQVAKSADVIVQVVVMLCSSSRGKVPNAGSSAEFAPSPQTLAAGSIKTPLATHFQQIDNPLPLADARTIFPMEMVASWKPVSIDVVTPFWDYERT